MSVKQQWRHWEQSGDIVYSQTIQALTQLDVHRHANIWKPKGRITHNGGPKGRQ